MDFYEALKEGATTTDLLNTFYRELDAASKKLEEERAKENEEKMKSAKIEALNTARTNLVDALYEYTKVLVDEPVERFDTQFFHNKLINLEKDYEELKNFSKELGDLQDIFNKSEDIFNKSEKKANKQPKVKDFSRVYTFDADEDVIRNFINSLK